MSAAALITVLFIVTMIAILVITAREDNDPHAGAP